VKEALSFGVLWCVNEMPYAGCRFNEGDSSTVMRAPAFILVFTFISSSLIVLWDTALSSSAHRQGNGYKSVQ
jgi:hypothetical protein